MTSLNQYPYPGAVQLQFSSLWQAEYKFSEEVTMFYTIEVDLDYDNHPGKEVHDIANRLRRVLLAAGFHGDGRRFTINLPPTKARQLARRSMEKLEHNLSGEGRSLYRYVREFYGYPTTCADNLLLPPTCTIEVRHGT